MHNTTNTDTSNASASIGDEIDFERRFGGIARLYGRAAFDAFQRAHVCVIGVGGVGSWAAEALARSAIGALTLIDLDHVAESNVNRQLHALSDTLGQAKVQALAQRIALINPRCEVHQIEDFITPDNVPDMIGAKFDLIIDAIDDVKAKVALIAYCRQHKQRLITIGGAGGQIDPTMIEVRDLCRTEQEPLLAKVRKRLRAHHGFPRGTRNKFGIDAVFSLEPLRMPEGEACEIPGTDSGHNGADDERSESGITGLNCAGFGSAMVVTASFGLVAVAHGLKLLAAKALESGVVAPDADRTSAPAQAA